MTAHEKEMKYSEYQTKTPETAAYPLSVSMLSNCHFYPALGLTDEAGEFYEKFVTANSDEVTNFTERERAELLKELGDVMWFISELCNRFGFSLQDLSEISKSAVLVLNPLDTLIVKCCYISGRVSKILRDKNNDIRDADFVLKTKTAMVLVMKAAEELSVTLGSSISEVLQINVCKLAKRKLEGVIQGDGDNRTKQIN